jgi:hypothetical protein
MPGCEGPPVRPCLRSSSGNLTLRRNRAEVGSAALFRRAGIPRRADMTMGLVTGTSSGIGLVSAVSLARTGHAVAVTMRDIVDGDSWQLRYLGAAARRLKDRRARRTASCCGGRRERRRICRAGQARRRARPHLVTGGGGRADSRVAADERAPLGRGMPTALSHAPFLLLITWARRIRSQQN